MENGSIRRMNRGDKNASKGRRGARWTVYLSISMGQPAPAMPSVGATLEASGPSVWARGAGSSAAIRAGGP